MKALGPLIQKTWVQNVHDHLGQVQSLGHLGVGPDPGVSQGMHFWQCCRKKKLLGMMKIVISSFSWTSISDFSCFLMSMTIWVRSRASDTQE